MDAAEQILQRTLVLRCQLGERRALDELFLRHNQALGYYLRQTLSRDDVADVQQEVWLTVIRRIGQLRNPEAFVVWLYRIARNKALTRLSQRAPVASLDDEGAGEIPDDAEAEFSPNDVARIHEKMAQRTDKHREVLTLRFLEDLSYDQIAEVIDCTAGTVRSRLHYAKAALRKLLEDSYEQIHDA